MKNKKSFIVIFLTLVLLMWNVPMVHATAPQIFVKVNGSTVSFPDAKPFVNRDNRTMVPIRFVANNLGAKVTWEGQSNTVVMVYGNDTITLAINTKVANVNDKVITLDTEAIIKNNRTLVPLRFISETFGSEVKWDNSTHTVLIQSDKYAPSDTSPSSNESAYSKQEKVTIGNKTFTVQVVEIPKGYKAHIGLADGVVGKTASLKSIAGNYPIAINGTYFNAYGGSPEPYGTLIQDGKMLHLASSKATLGFTSDGSVLLDRIKFKITGATNGSYKWPNNWYAYNFNHIPTKGGSSVMIFTPARGKTMGFAYGTNVVVSNGIVTKIEESTNSSIPSNGFVINFTGSTKSLLSRFSVGESVDYKTTITDLDGNELKDWENVQIAIGVGPMLVKNGKIDVNLSLEGFTEAKILTNSAARSGIGVKEDGSIILATTHSATIKEWAEVMQQLGTVNAMNLDGGASSGLYYNGKYITQPGRNLSNAIVFSKS
jgi:exopolysaccharide biosynthesis protein